MKKLVYILGILSIMVYFTSCFKEKDNWYTNTFKYDGRFSVAQTCDVRGELTDILFEDDYFFEDGVPATDYSDVAIEDGAELMIYNSAANVEDEIIVDMHIAGHHYIRGKFKITGEPSNFRGTGIANNIFSNLDEIADLEYWFMDNEEIDDWTSTFLYYIKPVDEGTEFDFLQLYTRFSLDEASITPDGETISGNPSDAVTVKITAYHDYLTVESFQTPAATWVKPDVPEYEWRIKEGSRRNADGEEEKWTLKGYRYTGYPEDDPNLLPPVIEKEK